MAKKQSQELNSFPCTACGQCCRRVYLGGLTAYLDRGDGVCYHFDDTSKLCTIYHERPLVCRVEDYYKAYLVDNYTWQEFVEMNVQVCWILQHT